jgi:hypothetical protein
MSAYCAAGKTTFVKNLLAPYAQDPNLRVNDASGPEALKIFCDTPEKLATTVLVNDHNSLTSFHYCIQNTPGASVGVTYVRDCTACLGRLPFMSVAHMAKGQAKRLLTRQGALPPTLFCCHACMLYGEQCTGICLFCVLSSCIRASDSNSGGYTQ